VFFENSYKLVGQISFIRCNKLLQQVQTVFATVFGFFFIVVTFF